MCLIILPKLFAKIRFVIKRILKEAGLRITTIKNLIKTKYKTGDYIWINPIKDWTADQYKYALSYFGPAKIKYVFDGYYNVLLLVLADLKRRNIYNGTYYRNEHDNVFDVSCDIIDNNSEIYTVT